MLTFNTITYIRMGLMIYLWIYISILNKMKYKYAYVMGNPNELYGLFNIEIAYRYLHLTNVNNYY